ncbi:MAG TPA: metalloregulator ArsR/SmtB family transcription factor [Dehalococcoidia bacterium]|nr:metalloregulator ArsR/SmtB family transcription factor [Dehalococcoidia bacterium]
MEPFSAIADPVRRRIVEQLASGEKTAGELGEGFAISQPAVSKHLRVLRQAGLVVARAQAQRRLYRLNPGPLAEVDAWLARCRNCWEERFDSLREYVERRDGERLTPVPARFPGRVGPDLAGREAGCRRRSRPFGAPLPMDQTAA